MGRPFIDDGGMIWTLIGFAFMIWLMGSSFVSSHNYKKGRNKKYIIGIFATQKPVDNGLFGFNFVPNLEGETLEKMRENVHDRDLVGVIRGIDSKSFLDRVGRSLNYSYSEESECYVMEKEKFIKIVKIFARGYSVKMF